MQRAGATPEQAERLDKIDTAAAHLLTIINDILDLAKIVTVATAWAETTGPRTSSGT